MKFMLLNAGSSSLKASMQDADDATIVAHGQADRKGASARYKFAGPDCAPNVLDNVEAGYASAVRRFVDDWRAVRNRDFADEAAPAAVGHRVVHGGQFTSSVRITPDVRSRIAELADLAPLEGLMMATRSGSIDLGLLLFVPRRHGLSPEQLESTLNRSSGLLGVSGVSSDMRAVLDDALVFTAGVGEHSAEIRAAVADGLQCLGLSIDRDANTACHPDADIAMPSSAVRILVIRTREDLTMLREVQRVLGSDQLDGPERPSYN